MSICLCGASADAVLEHMAREKIGFEPAALDPTTLSGNLTPYERALSSLDGVLPHPIELLVGNAKDRRSSSHVTCHVWRARLTSGSVLSLGDGLYVTSPELTLLHHAETLHQASVSMMLGRYLGTWTPAPESKGVQEDRAPLTTLETLSCFLRDVGRVRGGANLRLAMAYTCEGAASAPESMLQLVLSLPPELHGFGLPLPTMNYEVELSPKAQLLCGRITIRIDLCWRAKLFGLEYQGQEHGEQLGEDYARWFAAREEGYELWFLAKEQLGSARQMDYIGHEVAKRLGLDEDELLWPSVFELQELLDVMAGREHPKPVQFDELRRRRSTFWSFLDHRA